MSAPAAVASAPVGVRRRSIGAIVFDLVLLAFVVLIVVTALGLRPGARLVPLAVGIPTLVLLLIQLLVDLRGQVDVRRAALAGTDLRNATLSEVIEAARDEELEEIVTDDPIDQRRQALFAAWVIAYVALSIVTSFLVATPIAVAAILLVTRVQPILALALAGATGLGVWLVFDVVLQVRF